MQTYTFDYSQYKKKITPKKVKGVIPLILVIICLTLCIVKLPTKNTKQVDFFFVEINNFQTYSQASSLAQEIRNQGGAGYVYFDGIYRVFASVYLNENDAITVNANLSNTYSSSSILELSTKKEPSLKNMATEQEQSIIEMSKFYLNSISDVSSFIISFDKNELDETTLKNKLSIYQSESKKFYQTLLSMLPKSSNYNAAKDYALSINDSFNSLSNFSNSSDLKYNLIKLILSYKSFINCF